MRGQRHLQVDIVRTRGQRLFQHGLRGREVVARVPPDGRQRLVDGDLRVGRADAPLGRLADLQRPADSRCRRQASTGGGSDP